MEAKFEVTPTKLCIGLLAVSLVTSIYVNFQQQAQLIHQKAWHDSAMKMDKESYDMINSELATAREGYLECSKTSAEMIARMYGR